jgi:hypothetical protein
MSPRRFQPRVALRSAVVSEERITFLNLPAVSRSHLFEAARGLNGLNEPRGPALVVAQAAVEVGVETAIDFALQLRDVHDPLREWVATTVTSWSPTNERVQSLWTALTSDKITNAPGWAVYKEGTKQRHAFVHRAAAVSQEQAENFITAAEQVLGHVVDVMVSVFPSSTETSA